MGCVQAKPSPTYNRQHSRAATAGPGLNKLKYDNEYVAHKPIPVKENTHAAENIINGDGDDSSISRRKQEAGVEKITSSRRLGIVKKIGSDEMINGWPKWLVDNIPTHVLSNLVSKTADSYDKLAKVGYFTTYFSLFFFFFFPFFIIHFTYINM